jgi:putative transposase
MSIRQACVLFAIRQSVYYYQPVPDNDHEIKDKLAELSEVHRRWGFWMMHHHLRGLSHIWNHKRVYRIYTEMKLNMRRKHKRRLPLRPQESLVQPLMPNLTWSMDFMHDVLNNGIKFRTFNVIDDFNREGLNITLGTSITSQRVIRELERLIDWRGKPADIRVDNGPEFIAQVMENWAKENNIGLKFIPPGKPHKNGYVERFNRSFREEILDSYLFESIKQAQLIANAWLWSYNNERPHSSLKYLTPVSFLLKYGKLHIPQSQNKEFPTFQQDININLKSLILNATN